MSTTPLNLIRGDDVNLDLEFTDEEGTAIDITDIEVFFTVKARKSDTDDNAVISKEVTSHTDAVNGLSTVSLSKTETDIEPGMYHFDIQLKDSEGKVSSSVPGVIRVYQDITRRTQ